MNSRMSRLLAPLLFCLSFAASRAQVADLAYVSKKDLYLQTSSSSVVLDPRSVGTPDFGQRFQFGVQVLSLTADLSSFTAPSILLPVGSTAPSTIPSGHNGGVLVWNSDEGAWCYGSGGFQWATDTASSRDALFANGVYTVSAFGTSVNLNLPAPTFDANTPQVTLTGGTWLGGKYYVDVAQPLTITTNTFTNYAQNANGAVVLNLWRSDGDEPDLLFDISTRAANPLGWPVLPNADSKTYTVPAGTLMAGKSYHGEAQFLAVLSQVAGTPGTALANSFNLAARSRVTEFEIVTYSGTPPSGTFAIYAVGDLAGGDFRSSIRDATRVGGVIYATGGGTVGSSIANVDRAVLWNSATGFTVIPDLIPNNATSGVEGSVISNNGAYVAGRVHASSVNTDRRAVRITTSTAATLVLDNSTADPTASTVSTVSEDGEVLYGTALFTLAGKPQVVRFTATGPTVTAVPYPNPTDTTSILPLRGASADGSIVVGTSSATTAGAGSGNRAFRYVHSTGVSSLIPLLVGGTWNAALAVSPDGNLVLVRGNSVAYPNGEVYLYNVTTDVKTPLGSPNPAATTTGNARMTADGSVVITAFVQTFAPGSSVTTVSICNQFGWRTLNAVIGSSGIDLTGWAPFNTFLGMSPDGRFITGASTHLGATEGYIVEFPTGYLSQAAPTITSALTASGTYALPFSYSITATHQADDFDAITLPTGLLVDNVSGVIAGVAGQAGTFQVPISASNFAGTDLQQLTLTIAPASATVSLTDLSQVYDGKSKSPTSVTTPADLAVGLTFNGSSTAPTDVGNYSVSASITNPNYSGTTNGIFSITPASATVDLSNLQQTYDGSAKTPTVTTTPADLSNSVLYDGSPTAPTSAGTYAAVASVTDGNHVGSASGTFVIAPANATISLSNLSQLFDGNQKAVTVTTAPVGVAHSVTYDLSTTAPSAVGSYAVVVTITDGNYQGTPANGTLVIADVPVQILSQPVDASAVVGATAMFSVNATGSHLHYQWRKGTTNIGPDGPTLSLGSVQAADSGNYRVIVSNSANSLTSNPATLTVIVPVSITSQPSSLTVLSGAKATFTVAATGSNLAYQWQKNLLDIPGATSASYTIGKATTAEAGSYRVVVRNGVSSATSNVALLTVDVPPSITTQPADLRITAGQSATFSVVATGNAPLRYQWRRGNADIVNATSTSATLVLPAAEAIAGNYSVTVSSGIASTKSTTAKLTVR